MARTKKIRMACYPVGGECTKNSDCCTGFCRAGRVAAYCDNPRDRSRGTNLDPMQRLESRRALTPPTDLFRYAASVEQRCEAVPRQSQFQMPGMHFCKMARSDEPPLCLLLGRRFAIAHAKCMFRQPEIYACCVAKSYEFVIFNLFQFANDSKEISLRCYAKSDR